VGGRRSEDMEDLLWSVASLSMVDVISFLLFFYFLVFFFPLFLIIGDEAVQEESVG
jgi:hypothetical protein